MNKSSKSMAVLSVAAVLLGVSVSRVNAAGFAAPTGGFRETVASVNWQQAPVKTGAEQFAGQPQLPMSATHLNNTVALKMAHLPQNDITAVRNFVASNFLPADVMCESSPICRFAIHDVAKAPMPPLMVVLGGAG